MSTEGICLIFAKIDFERFQIENWKGNIFIANHTLFELAHKNMIYKKSKTLNCYCRIWWTFICKNFKPKTSNAITLKEISQLFVESKVPVAGVVFNNYCCRVFMIGSMRWQWRLFFQTSHT